MAHRTCTIDGCERKHVARGWCAYHYKKANPPKPKPVACPMCGEVTMRRDVKRKDATLSGFCSWDCRDLWRIETGNNPAPPKSKCVLPSDHPVRVLTRQRSAPARQKYGPMRAAFEAEDWAGLLAAIRSHCVEVDGCWLWSRMTDRSKYPRVFIAKREYRVHRLSKSAADQAWAPTDMPVHHICAEPLCVNPDHLQVITHIENTAEMLERRSYRRRISELEKALADFDPCHPLLRSRISPAA